MMIAATRHNQVGSMWCMRLALRCAKFNNVDLAACKQHKIDVVRVPDYLALMLLPFILLG
jgi:hypothetical protein